MINIILKLTFIDDVVDLLANALNSTINSNLPNDVLIVLTLSKLKRLIDWFRTVSDDILQLQRAKVCPFLLNHSQCNAWWDLSIRLIGSSRLTLVTHRFAPHSVFLKEWWSLSYSTLAECFINLVVFLIHWRRLRLRFLNTLRDLIGRLVLALALDLLGWLAIRILLEATIWLILLLAVLVKLVILVRVLPLLIHRYV